MDPVELLELLELPPSEFSEPVSFDDSEPDEELDELLDDEDELEDDDDVEEEDDDDDEDEEDDEDSSVLVDLHFLSFASLAFTQVSSSNSKTVPGSHSNLIFSYPLAFLSFFTHL